MRIGAAILGTVLLLGPVDAAQRKGMPPSIDLVELDVAVVDRLQQPVTGLTAKDFIVKDDGAAAAIKTFREVHATAASDPEYRRSITLLLDDVALPAEGTRAVQTIGKAFLQGVDARDELSVVRLHNQTDEPFGDRTVAESRLARFRAAAFPFADFDTVSELFGRVADISRQLESDDHRRKAIVCVGASVTCSAGEPAPSSVWPRHWSSWVAAVSSTATSNVAVYAIIPGRSMLRGGGLSDLTGGEVFATMYDVGPALDRILSDTSHYYMLGYWPSGKRRELHSIDLKVPRRGVQVYARRLRGNPPF
jgi:VWFA-related protein